ncbi:MAG: phospholipase effector Tle1 domain-containing protein [Acidiferrobacterales bacterium]
MAENNPIKSKTSIKQGKSNRIPVYSGGTCFGVFFDGTGNNRNKDIPNGNESNIAKLFDYYILDSYTNKEGIKCANNDSFYSIGVGSTAGTLALGGLTGAGAESRMNKSFDAVVDHFNRKENVYRKKKYLDVFGFSRGAASARHFVNMVKYLKIPDKTNGGFHDIELRFLGIFDTVGSFGIPGNKYDEGMDYHLDREFVKRTVHLTAEHEKRGLFDLTSIKKNKSEPLPGNCLEKSFPGAHSDVGGGYAYRAYRSAGWYKERLVPDKDATGKTIMKLMNVPEKNMQYEKDANLTEEAIYEQTEGIGEDYYLEEQIEKSNHLSRIPLKFMYDEMFKADINVMSREEHIRFEKSMKIEPQVQAFYDENKSGMPFNEAMNSKYIHDSRYFIDKIGVSIEDNGGTREIFYAATKPRLWENYKEERKKEKDEQWRNETA